MIICTGGAGFIGSNIVGALVALGKKVAVVDNLTNGIKFKNLLGLNIVDYFDKDNFRDLLAECLNMQKNALDIEAIIHNGACSSTTEWDGKYVLDNNYEYSRILLSFCQTFRIPFIYASSASVYGLNKHSKEIFINEKPMNVYGYSKLLFDNKVRQFLPDLDFQVVGLRYFNVYGPGENHKKGQSSPLLRFYQNVKDGKNLQIFQGDDGTGTKAEDYKRDFIYVNDVVNVILWFLDHPEKKGIFNVGTGECHSFVDVADYVLWYFEKHSCVIEYLSAQKQLVDFPKNLKGCSQPYTKADLTNLRAIGYEAQFTSLKEGTERYLNWLESQT